MKLSIIIVNYNVKYYLFQCLDSVEKATRGMETEVFVVDNHSHDGSIDFLRGHYPWVNFIENNHNQGFARANNLAIRQCSGDYVLLLNPDTFVGELTLREVVEHLDRHPQAGGVGVRMLNSMGEKARESRRGLPTPMTSLWKMLGLCQLFPRHRHFGRYYMGWLPWDRPVKIEIMSGAFCAIRRTALEKVGLLDEDFFMYGEDIDLSYRLLKGGYDNWYLPSAILHYKGESTHKTSFQYVHVFYKAMYIFYQKHFASSRLWFSLPITVGIYLKATAALVKMMKERVSRSLGFTKKRKQTPVNYWFFAPEEHLDELRKLARQRGLTAFFVEADEHLLPDGHLNDFPKMDFDAANYVVYDTSAYSYADILSVFGREPHANVFVGTYFPAIKTLITADETITLSL